MKGKGVHPSRDLLLKKDCWPGWDFLGLLEVLDIFTHFILWHKESWEGNESRMTNAWLELKMLACPPLQRQDAF